jgi:2-C-methyl-D-erythritol 4-phosphate cytidylyltransferase
MQSAFKEMATELGPKKPWRMVIGGKERQDSVWNGLQALAKETEVVAIQDGARPCTSEALIRETLDWARQTGAAVAAQRVTDTIKESEDGKVIACNVDRSKLWSVQTPQAFRVNVIRRAIEAARERGLHLTDDTAACELIGQAVRLVEGKEPNPKVTLPADIPYIAMLLRANSIS